MTSPLADGRPEANRALSGGPGYPLCQYDTLGYPRLYIHGRTGHPGSDGDTWSSEDRGSSMSHPWLLGLGGSFLGRRSVPCCVAYIYSMRLWRALGADAAVLIISPTRQVLMPLSPFYCVQEAFGRYSTRVAYDYTLSLPTFC